MTIKTQTTKTPTDAVQPHTLLRAAVRAAVGCAIVTGLCVDGVRETAMAAPRECYDFSQLEPATRYLVGATVQAQHADIEITRFFVEEGLHAQDSDAHFVEVHNGRIAGGETPELRFYIANARVTPHQPVRKVRFLFAENTGGLLANLAVNGEGHVVAGGLAQANGHVLGDPAIGLVDITVTMTSFAPGGTGFNKGVVEIEARGGGSIEWFSLGGLQFFVDDLCFAQ